VKLSLFDVTNVTAPTETAKYVVQADWSDSTVLMDHKAFLFDKPKQLLALPVSTSWIWVNGEKEYYSKGFWQGAYVFNVSLEQGFTLKGNITHQNGADQFESGLQVKRILYIDNVLYTISDKKIKINSLENLDEIKKVVLL
jgi:inhibitor of cysteine peptidase